MRVSLAKLLHQVVMGRILALEYMLLGGRGLLWPCHVLSSNKCYLLPRARCW
jgi:hypothetical protein